jgi:putative FmdB family regulatory protein
VPTYQYSCTECGHSLEAVQKFTDDSLTVCPECGGRLRKVFNAVGVVFKGSGFYRTDSRAATSGADTSSGTSHAHHNGNGSTHSGTDTKTETKASSTPAKTESKPAAAGA